VQALTALYHFLFVPLTLGLHDPVIMEVVYMMIVDLEA
jgi:cytochrome bd-type quinol oxidase subunit 1